MYTISVSPCSTPELSLEEALSAFREAGYSRVELFTSWAKSAVDYTGGSQRVEDALFGHDFAVSSIHLPPVDDDIEGSVERAVRCMEFALALGCSVGIYKAGTRDMYIRAAGQVIEAAGKLGFTPVLQNHAGTAISTIDDYREVLEGIADPRMKCTLEVGHFHSVGVEWRDGYELLQGRIGLVHIKDQVGARSVAFGRGEIDLPGLFSRLKDDGYGGDVVVEMEVADSENTLDYLRDARAYVKENAPWITRR